MYYTLLVNAIKCLQKLNCNLFHLANTECPTAFASLVLADILKLFVCFELPLLILRCFQFFDESKIGAPSHEIEEVAVLRDLRYKINIMLVVQHFLEFDYVSVVAHGR